MMNDESCVKPTISTFYRTPLILLKPETVKNETIKKNESFILDLKRKSTDDLTSNKRSQSSSHLPVYSSDTPKHR